MIGRARENNFDLLRILCTIAIVAIHVASIFTIPGTTRKPELVLFCDSVLRFAVPCFVMLSGAFLLSDNRNKNFKYFYRKSFIKLGIPTIIFSILYIAIGIIASFCHMPGYELSSVIRGAAVGIPCYHMWYLYMLIGVYALIPVILMLKEKIGEKNFSRVTWVFLVLAILSFWTSTHTLSYDIGLSFEYCGFLMVGYEIYKNTTNNKKLFRGIILILAGVLVESALYILFSNDAAGKLSGVLALLSHINPLDPLQAIGSILIFSGFANLNIKINLGKFSSRTFLVYLMHAGVWAFIRLLINKFGTADHINEQIYLAVPIFTIVVYIVSDILSILYARISSRVSIIAKRSVKS